MSVPVGEDGHKNSSLIHPSYVNNIPNAKHLLVGETATAAENIVIMGCDYNVPIFLRRGGFLGKAPIVGWNACGSSGSVWHRLRPRLCRDDLRVCSFPVVSPLQRFEEKKAGCAARGEARPNNVWQCSCAVKSVLVVPSNTVSTTSDPIRSVFSRFPRFYFPKNGDGVSDRQ
jgi:hypothetical protein